MNDPQSEPFIPSASFAAIYEVVGVRRVREQGFSPARDSFPDLIGKGRTAASNCNSQRNSPTDKTTSTGSSSGDPQERIPQAPPNESRLAATDALRLKVFRKNSRTANNVVLPDPFAPTTTQTSEGAQVVWRRTAEILSFENDGHGKSYSRIYVATYFPRAF